MVNLERATKAQDKLGGRIGRKPWLRGIAVLSDNRGSHYIRVNVQSLTDEVGKAIPEKLDGVPVTVEVIGRLRALPV